jgi:hypothetical protein
MAISLNWFYFANSEASLTEIPAGAIPFQLNKQNSIELDSLEKRKHFTDEECIVYNSFDLDAAQEIIFGCGVDWFFEAYLNGERLYSTMISGNGCGYFTPENHLFSGNCRKGKNLLAVRVRRGLSGSAFAFAEIAPGVVTLPSAPLTVCADPGNSPGKIKLMNAVNNGPIVARGDQSRGNLALWKAAKIPYARNHDAAFCSGYGGEHSVDIHAIFPDFSKDPYDAASYDFTLTDHFHQQIIDAGTKVFFRLGSKIEHNIKKYGTVVPPDFKKWAVICEHIIRHCNEGWADGHHMNIEYWEIWNEPDLSSGAEDKKTWQGTDEEFFELYRTAATHLKKCFPHLKIGGPALAHKISWMREFLTAMTVGERVPIDFFSWHIYTVNPPQLAWLAGEMRRILDEFGYCDTESILDEWNYVGDWGAGFTRSIETIIGLKGAVFTVACMSAAQEAPVDMLMYYDARPCAFNGLFDFYTYRALKGYYSFVAWSKLVDLGTQINVDTGNRKGIYATGATDGKGKTGILISRYFADDELPETMPLTIKVNGVDLSDAKLFVVDEEHDFEEVSYQRNGDGTLSFNMEANTFIYLEA